MGSLSNKRRKLSQQSIGSFFVSHGFEKTLSSANSIIPSQIFDLIPPRWKACESIQTVLRNKRNFVVPVTEHLKKKGIDAVSPKPEYIFESLIEINPDEVRWICVVDNCVSVRENNTGIPCSGRRKNADAEYTGLEQGFLGMLRASGVLVQGMKRDEVDDILMNASGTLRGLIHAPNNVLIIPANWTCNEGDAWRQHSEIGWRLFTRAVIEAALAHSDVKGAFLWGFHSREFMNCFGPETMVRTATSPYQSRWPNSNTRFQNAPFPGMGRANMHMTAKDIDWACIANAEAPKSKLSVVRAVQDGWEEE